MVKRDERKPQPITETMLVQNWVEELKRLAPEKEALLITILVFPGRLLEVVRTVSEVLRHKKCSFF
jgi:hypothetical protein